MTSWMDNQPLTDVQTAIQTQTIQTALESNTSKITDAGFQSFLTSAPIPRFYAPTITGTYNNATVTTATFTTVGLLDPYGMFTVSTGLATLPIDGWYSFDFNIQATGGAAGHTQLIWVPSAGGNLAAQVLPSAPAANTTYQHSLSVIAPMRQGDTLKIQVGNGTGAGLSAITGHISGVWVAPYNQYVGGNA